MANLQWLEADAGPVVAETSHGCRILRSPSIGYVVTTTQCPDRHWDAPNLPTAYALCESLEGRGGHRLG